MLFFAPLASLIFRRKTRCAILLVMLSNTPLIPQKLGIHPFGGSVPVLPGLLDSILVSLVRLVVRRVVLRLRHFPLTSKRVVVNYNDKNEISPSQPSEPSATKPKAPAEDLLHVENQLPFFVLHNLFLLIFGPSINVPFSLIDLALDFFNHDLLTRSGSRTTTSNKSHVQTAIKIESICHLLHLFHLHLQPSPPARLQNQPPLILCSNGLSFPRRSSRLWAVRMGGAPGTALLASIPSAHRLPLDQLMLRNFIAMEQCFPKLGSHFTSYAYLMDCIVNTAEDGDVLGRKDITGHWLGSDEEVALLLDVHRAHSRCPPPSSSVLDYK